MKDKRINKWDGLFILIAVVIAAALYFSGLLSPGGEGAYAVIYEDGKEIGRYPLDEDVQFTVALDSGENTIKISEGRVFVESADCPDGLCVKQGEIHRHGETIVCLPHKLVVEIEGSEPAEFDVILQ